MKTSQTELKVLPWCGGYELYDGVLHVGRVERHGLNWLVLKNMAGMVVRKHRNADELLRPLVEYRRIVRGEHGRIV
jgi:hypothetical protein